MAAGCAAQAGQRQGRGRARPRGSRTPEPGSIVVAAERRGSKAASEARAAAPWSLSKRVPGEAGARRPGGARRASCAGDEGPLAPPARNAAAAGRLHCLTTARAQSQPGAWSAASAGRPPQGGAARLGRGARFLGHQLLSDVSEAILPLQGEPSGDRGQRVASRPLLQRTPHGPLSASEKDEAAPLEGGSEGLDTRRVAAREPLGMLTAQDLKESSVSMSSRIHAGVNAAW
ncbi:uncharacterized protein AAES06_021533 isoform 2-T2 [Glossophaga mutica]